MNRCPKPIDETAVEGQRGRFAMVLRLAKSENLTVRQILRRLVAARGHYVVVGTPEQIADNMEQWYRQEACDGFNLMPSLFPSQLELFVDEVVPILQRRGLFHTAHEGTTLREHYRLEQPPNRFAGQGTGYSK